MTNPEDERFMRIALDEALGGMAKGEKPFGAVLVNNGKVVARGRNLEYSTFDPTTHAETVALRNAGTSTRALSFPGATLYASWEPCPMCMGAIMNTGCEKLVLGGRNSPQGSRFGPYTAEKVIELAGFGDRLEVITGVLQDEIEGAVTEWQRKQSG